MNTAVVVGAGFAGLSAALELAKSGVRVTVLEASGGPGGRAQRFTTSGGFTFDSGPTLLVMTDVLRTILGDERFAALALRRLEPGYRVVWPDGASFDLSSDVVTLLGSMQRFAPAPKASAALRYLADVHALYREARATILERDHTPLSFAAAMMRGRGFRPWAFGSLEAFAGRYFQNRRVVEALTFQPLYIGTSPLRSPALYAMLGVEEIVGGIWYGPGGTGAVVDALVAACLEHGVVFRYGLRVTGIAAGAGRAHAVDSTLGVFPSDAVVISADREPANRDLAGDAGTRRKLRYGHSAAVWYLGIDRPVDAPHHTVLLPAEPRTAFSELDRGRLPLEPLVYCCNPAASDPAVAPAGGAALLVLSPVPNRAALPEMDERPYFERVLSSLERYLGPLRRHITYRQFRGPLEFERDFRVQHGAAFGPDHLLDQMGPFRPPIRHPRLANVVFAGSGTHPGAGVPMVLLSGRLAARRLLGGAA